MSSACGYVIYDNNLSVGLEAAEGLEYRFGDTSQWQMTDTKTYNQYEEDVAITVKDANNELAKTVIPAIKVDDEAPVILGIERTTDEEDNIVDIIQAGDNESGIKEYSFDGGVTWQEENTFIHTGTPTTPNAMVRDYALNCSNAVTVYMSIEITPTEWTSDDVSISVTEVGGNSAAIEKYSFDGEETWQLSDTKTFSSNQDYLLISAKDANEDTYSLIKSIGNIDKETPEIETTITVIDFDCPTILVNAVDIGSGIESIKWEQGERTLDYFESAGTELIDEYAFLGEYDEVYTIYAVDKVGNEAVSTIVAEEPPRESVIGDLVSGSTDSAVYGEFDYLVGNDALAKYLVATNLTPALVGDNEEETDSIEYTEEIEYTDFDENEIEYEEDEEEEGDEEEEEIENYDELDIYQTLVRENIGAWMEQVTLGTAIPLLDANDCIVACAYDYEYTTEDTENTPVVKTGTIVVAKHTQEGMYQFVEELQLNLNSEKRHYYFSNLDTNEYQLFEKTSPYVYRNVISEQDVSTGQFKIIKEQELEKLSQRDLYNLSLFHEENCEQLTGIHNDLTISDESLEETYGEFDWDVDYESMAQFLIAKQLSSAEIGFEDLSEIVVDKAILLYDENDIVSARGFNFYTMDSETEGHLILSTHTEQPLLLSYEVGSFLSPDYEKTFYLNNTLYYFDGTGYYDINELLLSYDPTAQIVPMSTFTVLEEQDSPDTLIDELNGLIDDYAEETQSESPMMLFSTSTVNWPKLQLNNGGTTVTALQYLLKSWGCDPGTIDGDFGPKTKAAVEKFQTKNKDLGVDGIAGKKTLSKLVSTLKYRSTGNKVKAAQVLLSKKYLIGLGTIDGIFGNNTEAAVKSFKRARGLTSTGGVIDSVVGNVTWKYLFGNSPAPSKPAPKKLNSYWNTSNSEKLRTDLITNGYKDFNSKGLSKYYAPLSMYTRDIALDWVKRYDKAITNYANDQTMPKELVQAVIFREMYCYDIADAGKDELVAGYYKKKFARDEAIKNKAKKIPAEPSKTTFWGENITDSSTGIAQLFGYKVRRVWNKRYPAAEYSNDWKGLYSAWDSVRYDHERSARMATESFIYNGSYNINNDVAFQTKESKISTPYTNLTSSQRKILFFRYNNDHIKGWDYALICESYYQIFRKYR